MKKKLAVFILACVMVLAFAGLVACGGGGVPMTADGYPDDTKMLDMKVADVD